MNNTEKLIETYKDKILGVRNYKHDKREFYVSDFIDFEKLKHILDEIYTGESDITPAGKNFLALYYGFKVLGQLLFENKDVSEFSFSDSLEFEKWLTDLEPMATISFIEKTRGNIDVNSVLRDDLLPPSED